MTHWSWKTGAALLTVTYIALGALVIWGPPPVKVWAFGILVPLPPWTMEIAIMSFGAYIAKDWGHGDNYQSTSGPVEALVSTEFNEPSSKKMVWAGGYCDPDDLTWWC